MNKKGKQKNKLRNKSYLKKGSIFLGAFSVASIIGATVASCGVGIQWKSSIQLVVSDNSSTLADQSFSENTYDGIRNFYINDLKIPASDVPQANSPDVNENNGIWRRPGTDDTSRINTYINAKNDGSNIVVATGFNQNKALQQISDPTNQYHDELANTGFVFVDGAIDTSKGSDPTNIASVSFRADEGSFLAGIATAVYLNLNQNYFTPIKDSSGKPVSIGVSSFVGLALPSTVSYLNGWRLGLLYWNQYLVKHLNLETDSDSVLPISWVTSDNKNDEKGLDINSYVSTSFNANEPVATTLTSQMVTNGASFIFPIAGPQTQLVVNQISQMGGHTAVLGVDTAQENVTNLQIPLKGAPATTDTFINNSIPFSSLKKLDFATENILNAIHTGSVSNGYHGFGWNNIADLSNGGVGISDQGLSFLIDPFLGVDVSSSSTSKTFDFNSVTTKPKLRDLVKTNSAKQDPKILENYKHLLVDGWKISDSSVTPASSDASWVIKGDEMTTKSDNYLPKFATSVGGSESYTIAAAFGGTATQQVAKGTLLNGTDWKLGISKE